MKNMTSELVQDILPTILLRLQANVKFKGFKINIGKINSESDDNTSYNNNEISETMNDFTESKKDVEMSDA